MFRSLSRIAVAVALVFAFTLSAVPAQAQPRDFGSGSDLDTSWLEVALGWLQGFLGGDPELPWSMTAKSDIPIEPAATGPCIDPYGTGNCRENP
jgi:hypothetical protein